MVHACGTSWCAWPHDWASRSGCNSSAQCQKCWPLLAQSEALLLSSNFEGFPSVCVEALAAGTFVIARDAGAGVREILRGPRTGHCRGCHADRAGFCQRRARASGSDRGVDAAAARAVAARYVIAPIASRYLQLLDDVAACHPLACHPEAHEHVAGAPCLGDGQGPCAR